LCRIDTGRYRHGVVRAGLGVIVTDVIRRVRRLASRIPLPGASRTTMIVALVVAVVATVAAFAIWSTRGGPTEPPLVITDSGSLVDGQRITGAVEVRADNVTIRNSQIESGGAVAVRLFPGYRGLVLEDTTVRCRSGKADGVGDGNFDASRVRVYGCKRPFVYSDVTPATIVDSFWNDHPYRPVATSGPENDPGRAGLAQAPTTAAAAPRGPKPSAPPLSSWPGQQTTGVPAGTALTPSGSLDLDTDGQVVSGLDITGCVDVRGRNVTIKKSRITCSRDTWAVRTFDGVTNLVLEDVEINGSGKNSAAVCCGNYTLRRVNVHDSIDGPRLGSNTSIVDSWIHDLTRVDGSHGDTLQTTGARGILVKHNRLEPYKTGTSDPNNAAIMVGSTTAPEVRDMVVEDNYCNGGNYTIGIRGDMTAVNVVFRRNWFGRNYRYGVIANWDQPGVTWEDSNVYLDNQLPVVSK